MIEDDDQIARGKAAQAERDANVAEAKAAQAVHDANAAIQKTEMAQGMGQEKSSKFALNEAKEAITLAEKARTEAEGARGKAELARGEAEEARGKAEKVRSLAEEMRTKAEAVRSSTETERIRAEDAKRIAEEARSKAELALRTVTSAQEKAHLAEERYRFVVEGTDDGLWDWDLEKGNIYWSGRFFRMFGIDETVIPAEAVFYEHVHPEDLQRIQDAVQFALQNARRLNEVFRMRHTDGHYIHCLLRGKTLFNEQCQAIRMAGMISDISDRIEDQEKIRRYASQLEQSNKDLE
jgi:PAS domain S-box-containing protein